MRVAGTRICRVGTRTRTALRAEVGWVQVKLVAGRVRVVLDAGAGRAWVEKLFERVTEC